MIKELLEVQSALKAPKGQYNSFGKYKYRSAEDILEAVKPLLQEKQCTLILSDEVLPIGNRIYVKATATFSTSQGAQVVTTAYAREEEVKKGMDGSQITGTASSYARKYAMNGLFLIDDAKDADTDEYQKQINAKKQSLGYTEEEMKEALNDAESIKTKEEYKQVWAKWAAKNVAIIQSDTEFYKAFIAKSKEV